MAHPLLMPMAALQKHLASAKQFLTAGAFAPRVAHQALREEAGPNNHPGWEAWCWVQGRCGLPSGNSCISLLAESGMCFLGRAGSWMRLQVPDQWPLPGAFQSGPHPRVSLIPFFCSVVQLKERILQQPCSLCRLFFGGWGGVGSVWFLYVWAFYWICF